MRTEVTVAVLVMVVTSDDFRVNEEGGPKIEFLTKAKWEHVLGESEEILGFQNIQNAI